MDALSTFKEISDVVIDAYFVTDRELRILDFNRAFFALFPRQISRKLKGRLVSEVMEVDRDVARECLEAGHHVRLDEISVRLAGSGDEIRAILSGIPLRDSAEGSPVGALVIVRNVTDEASIQVKYQEMLETEARERERLVEQINERTKALVDTNELLLRIQRELTDYKKGLRA